MYERKENTEASQGNECERNHCDRSLQMESDSNAMKETVQKRVTGMKERSCSQASCKTVEIKELIWSHLIKQQGSKKSTKEI